VACDGTLDSPGQVVPQMPPVGDLDRQRRALGCAFGVAAAAVAADDLHARMRIEPACERLRGSLRQHVHRPASLDIHQHRAVDVSLAQREVVHSQHQRHAGSRVGRGADQPEQRRPAHGAGQLAAEARTGAAAQRERDCLQHVVQVTGPPAVTAGQARHLLSERDLRACLVSTHEPAGPQDDKHLLAAARGIGQSPLVMAVHPPRQHTTSRARCPAGTGRGQHTHRLADCDDILDDQARQLGGQDSKSLKIARPA
jgi:hypothetical protein